MARRRGIGANSALADDRDAGWAPNAATMTLNDYRRRGYATEGTGQSTGSLVLASLLVAGVLAVDRYIFFAPVFTKAPEAPTIASSSADSTMSPAPTVPIVVHGEPVARAEASTPSTN